MSAALSHRLAAMQSKGKSRLRYIVVPPKAQPDFRSAVVEGLRKERKSIPSRFLYDAVGSALFEAITLLDEYYLTRKERSILRREARNIVQAVAPEIEIIEFGSGSAEKTRLLLDAALRGQDSLRFIPIDISEAALQASATNLLNEHPSLDIVAIAAEYRDALGSLPAPLLPRLFLFLGSNIGNFSGEDARAFLGEIAKEMRREDRLLIGLDLVKDPNVIELAYNDPTGVTAAFDKNLLSRVNRELGGTFDLSCFHHSAVYVAEEQKIEMRLVSQCDQSVSIKGEYEPFQFRPGDYIHTEDSNKYKLEGFAEMAREAGLELVERWKDEDKWFALTLLEKA